MQSVTEETAKLLMDAVTYKVGELHVITRPKFRHPTCLRIKSTGAMFLVVDSNLPTAERDEIIAGVIGELK